MNYNDKLNDILKIIEKNHIDFYFNHSKEELEAFKNYALAKFKLEDDYDLLYVVNYLIKKMMNENDSHTTLYMSGTNDNTLGINFRIINNKVYIYKIADEYNEYLYSEVLKINNIDINTILKELCDISSAQTKEGIEFKVEDGLSTVLLLKSLPSIDNNASDINITVKENDVVKEFTAPIGKLKKINYQYNVTYDTMHIIYSQCAQQHDGQMQEFIDEIKQVEGIKTYIVDLRGNTGGNSQIIKPLIEYLKNKNVIVLIDKYVFSAGRFACVGLKEIGATFIGTDIGTPINCFGNCPGEKYDCFNICASQKYFAFNPNIKIEINSKEKLDSIRNMDYVFEPRYFHPNIYVRESIDALKEGRDVYLEEAFKYIDSLNIDKNNNM